MVSNVVDPGMDGTEASLSMDLETAAIEVQLCVSPMNVLPAVCQTFLLESHQSLL
jgi:hypothetical protein